MKIIIEIPEKTSAHIRSDYGHGVKGLRIEDMEMLVDAVYHGEPYHVRPRGEWKEFTVSTYRGTDEWGEPKWGKGKKFICKRCGRRTVIRENFCPNCGRRMKKEGGANNEM